MSASPLSQAGKVTIPGILEKKNQHQPITCLTAYDYATSRLVDEAGIDMILVGDSLAMVVLGYENTLPVTVDEMLHHTRAVRRAVKRALVIADMPYASYHIDEKDAVKRLLCGILEVPSLPMDLAFHIDEFNAEGFDHGPATKAFASD